MTRFRGKLRASAHHPASVPATRHNSCACRLRAVLLPLAFRLLAGRATQAAAMGAPSCWRFIALRPALCSPIFLSDLHRMVSRTLRLALLALACTVDLSRASAFTENGLSLLSYQLCSHPATRRVQKLQEVQTSHTAYVHCGGWIPWRKCPRTVYRTQYLAVEVSEARNVTDCCEGYEQLGLYCVLPLNRSSEFASRPGVCPTAEPELSSPACSLDTDCPGLQKCCSWPGGRRCVAPVPAGAERSLVSWYNLTVLVKMGFEDLQREDPGLRNHTRLLYSLVTSALQPLNPAVHYLNSTGGGDTFTTASWLLLGLPQPMAVANVSAMLDDMVNRVYEVISIQLQDVNECLYGGLHACSGGQQCLNVEGSYQCVSTEQKNHMDEDCPPIQDFMALHVTSSSFRVSWSLNSTQNHTFHVQVYKGKEILKSTWARSRILAVSGLEAGVLYGVRTSYQGCGTNVSASLIVKTDAQVFQLTIRVTNLNLTEQLLDCSSVGFWNFSRQLFREVESSFPQAIADMYRRGKLRMQIVSLEAGSLVVTLRLTLQDPEFPVGVSSLRPMLQPLSASAVFQVDQQGTLVQDWDECAHSSEHDCHPAARCINLEGSYTCQCLTARDANPSRAGRVCEGDMVTPTGGGLSVTAKATAPAVSMEITAFGPETLTSTPSPEQPRSTPARGQAQTPGPPSKRDGGSTVGQEKNSTGQGVEVPSMALSLDRSHGSTSGVISSSSESPEPIHGSPRGSTDISLRLIGESQEYLLTDPPFMTSSPTGYVDVWHPSLDWEIPLNSTRLQNADPWPSSFPGLPSAPTPEAPEPPTCVPGSIRKVTVSNVTSTSFSLEWPADISLSPTFYLTLVSPRGPAVTMETRDNNVTWSGLEPGALYLVEIVAKECGKEGARTQVKVRTVAQKLAGEVRIVNIQYSESFRNASSGEHRDFLQLFFRTLRESLPSTLCQHMDTGRIRVDITNITNGSVVVEFSLLVMADLNVTEVSAAFLAALQNTSLLEVDRGKTFIRDYNECEMREDDCAPGACRNTFGSFTCTCDGVRPDWRVEYSGRSCDGGSPGSTVQTSGLEWPPSPAGTRGTDVPDASSVPQALPLRLNLTDAVGVSCEIETVGIAIQKRFLQQEAIPEASLYLGEPSCNVSESNGTHVFLTAGWAECGTLVESNMTSTVVKTTLRNDVSPDGIIHHLQILSPIHCVFRNDLLTSSGYTPQWGVYTVIEDLHGTGNFVTEMQLFIGESPIPQNYSVSASDEVKIQVGLHRQKSSLKVVLTECWATPSSDARDPITFGFINNSCPVPNTYTSVIQNGNSSKAQFKLRIFSFVNNSIVYLHCKLRVCVENPRNSCKISCNDFRLLRRREAEHQMSWGPLLRSQAARPEPGLGTGYIILISVAAFTVVAVAATLLILRYQRARGKYNLRIQSDDFSYQVFSQ
ncbi:uromodulin-like 1 [Meriones unguiculatus]|uniref:uromodulin-like 1 n=1 Tax=Meriones unguiculatus TaxID=10047 RepID=UPI00293E651F|nr:uromodulin-like 1 [Meriones unguiculatus]